MKRNRLVTILVSIFLGMFVGGLVLFLAGYNPFEAYKVMINGVFGKPKYLSWTIINATPLILTGISVAFAFNTGLFNIGAEGQFIIGSLVATLVGYFVKLPPVIHPIVAILAGMLAGALWAGIAGYLKAKLEINEVITTIMLNWIAIYLSNFIVFREGFKRATKDSSEKVLDSASINVLGEWKRSGAGKEFFSTKPFLKDFFSTPVNYGIVIAILMAILIWYVLKNTTLGYQLRAVGHNKEAAEYGGINIKKNIIVSMMIAGAISGLAGATQILGVTKDMTVLASTEGYGFDGMAVALIAGNNPLACIPAGLLFGGLKYGGMKLQPKMGAPFEIVNIIIGIIVFFIAIPKLLKHINIKKKKGGVDVDNTK